MAEIKSEAKSDSRILILPGHPVSSCAWRALAEHYALLFLYPQAKQHADSLALATAHLGQFYSPDAQEWAANETARMLGELHSAQWDFQRFSERLPHDLNSRLPQWWPGYILTHAQGLAQRIASLEVVSQKYEVSGLVLHEDVAPDTRSMALWARARGIPTIHVPHANCHLRDDAGPDIHRETRTDWLAASGAYAADWYARQGFPREQITVVGAPQWDALYEDVTDRDSARRIFGFEAGDTVLVYATTWAQTTGLRGGWQDEHEAGLAAVLSLAKEMSAALVIKIHPNDQQGSEDIFAERMKAAEIHGRVTRQHNAFALRAADVFVAQGPSNMCVEAAIMGTPACYIQTEGFDYSHALPFRCAPDGLSQAARLALESRGDPLWQDFIRFYNDVHPGGGAVARLVEFVREKCP